MTFRIPVQTQQLWYFAFSRQGELDFPSFRNFRILEAQGWAEVGGLRDGHGLCVGLRLW